MAFMVHNVPIVPVYVKKEYLYDLEKGHGELTPGVWITVKSVMGKALYFETLLTDYGALFDKLPISAFVWKEDYDKDNQLPLDVLQIWDCFDYDITVTKKSMLADCEFFGKDKKMHKGEYIFTIDNAHRDKSIIDTVEEVLIEFNIDIVNSLKKLGSNATSFHTKSENIIEVEPGKE